MNYDIYYRISISSNKLVVEETSIEPATFEDEIHILFMCILFCTENESYVKSYIHVNRKTSTSI